MWFQACHGIDGCKNEPVVRCRDCEGLQMYCQSCIVSYHCAMPLHNVEVFFFQSFVAFKFSITSRSGQANTFDVPLFVTLVYECNSVILWGARVVTHRQPLMMNLYSSISMESIVLCSISVTANLLSLMPFNYCVFAGILPQLPTLGRLLPSGSSIIFRCIPLNPKVLHSSIIKLCLAYPTTQAQRGLRCVFYYYLFIYTLFTNLHQDRYEPLLRMSRQYRHLIALKRAGRAHDITGTLGTKPGELAVVCPACPQPGMNLPVDWTDAPADKR